MVDPLVARPARGGWTVVLPVQHGDRAKTRLMAPDGTRRSEVARAIATDCLAAVRGCELVGRRVVVTSDPRVGPAATRAGDQVLADPGVGLAGAVDRGLAAAVAGDPLGPVAVLLPDVPALQPQDLTDALKAAAAHAFALVPDAEGTGTVLLTAVPGRLLRHSFGRDSAVRHARLGATRLDLDLPRLRRDVDTLAALATARKLGLGPATMALLAAVALPE